MPLLKNDKRKLAKQYVKNIDNASNAVVLSHKGISVNALNAIRMDIDAAEGELQVVKKRILQKGVEGTYEGLDVSTIGDSIMVLYSHNQEDQHAPLKVISKHTKAWKKEKKAYEIGYVGGWYEKLWKDGSYVEELANLPSKEDLLSKLVFLLQSPLTSLARGLQAIADKDGEGTNDTPQADAEASSAEEIDTTDTPETGEKDAPSEEVSPEEASTEEEK